MANAGGISVTDSAVYKVIRTHRNSHSRKAHQGQSRHSFCDNEGTRWAFLQRLLAIEEAHDQKKKMAAYSIEQTWREDKSRFRKQDSVESPLPPIDPGSRWIHDQVLDDDSPEDCDGTEHHDDLTYKLPSLETTNRELEPHRAHSSSDNYDTQFPRIQTDKGLTGSVSNASSMLQISVKAQSFSELSPQVDELDRGSSARLKRKRPLRLPPILLPKVYTIAQRPLQCREFLTPTKIRGPITDSEWEELKDCRYIRHALPRFSLQVSSSNVSSFHS
ncbi:uncharacterized protein LOC106012021 [Aplysia californica]|uniref:Uncharacterized protein LOC106012021 n=1 Tax=Aplysia californica TaxID=6500 RepID=A0ABM1A1S7_APLCA|nr:uncharacterized protein LOC106012021 [Aplysia californica]